MLAQPIPACLLVKANTTYQLKYRKYFSNDTSFSCPNTCHFHLDWTHSFLDSVYNQSSDRRPKKRCAGRTCRICNHMKRVAKNYTLVRHCYDAS
jgi:hypothetical protein